MALEHMEKDRLITTLRQALVDIRERSDCPESIEDFITIELVKIDHPEILAPPKESP